MAYGTRRFMPHSQGPSNNPYPEPNQPNFSNWHQFFLRSILMLFSHLRLGLPKGIFLAGLPVKILKACLRSSILATWPVHLSLLDLITLTILGERYKQWSYSLWSLLHFPFSSLLDPNIHLRILLSNTFCLRFSLNVRDHASQPYSTTGNIIVSYTSILIFKFLERSQEDKTIWTE
jgi:hypothetical protein